MTRILTNTFKPGASWSKVKLGLAVAVLGASMSAAHMASANPKPSPSKAASAQVIANHFAGRMHVWKSCKGGSYFGGKWEAVAYCGKHKNSVGVGQWTTQGGKLCRKITWYFARDGKLASKPEEVKCELEFVTDADGQIWHRWLSDKEWWRGFPKDKNFSKGNKYKRQTTRLRKQLGV